VEDIKLHTFTWKNYVLHILDKKFILQSQKAKDQQLEIQTFGTKKNDKTKYTLTMSITPWQRHRTWFILSQQHRSHLFPASHKMISLSSARSSDAFSKDYQQPSQVQSQYKSPWQHLVLLRSHEQPYRRPFHFSGNLQATFSLFLAPTKEFRKKIETCTIAIGQKRKSLNSYIYT